MLKIIKLFDRPVFRKNNSSKSVFKKNNNNSKIVKFSIINNMKLAKKSKKSKN